MFMKKIMTVGLLLLASLSVFADAQQEVVKHLKSSGLSCGYDAARKRWIAVGFHEMPMTSPSVQADFFHQRQKGCILAEMRARREIAKMMNSEMRLRDEARIHSDAKGSVREIASLYEFLSKAELKGATVLQSAESWDGASYQVAVAVGVSESREVIAEQMMAPNSLTSVEEDEESTWKRWAESQDLAVTIGARYFKDPLNGRCIVGIGMADVQGKRGLQLKQAYVMAQVRARENLAHALASDTVVKDTAMSVYRAIEKGELTSEQADEQFVIRIRRAARVTVRGGEVYSTEVKHPITGHRVYVSVYGMKLTSTRQESAVVLTCRLPGMRK